MVKLRDGIFKEGWLSLVFLNNVRYLLWILEDKLVFVVLVGNVGVMSLYFFLSMFFVF